MNRWKRRAAAVICAAVMAAAVPAGAADILRRIAEGKER